MVFSSQIFLFYFLPCALLLYYAVPRAWRLLMLTLVSLVFYAWIQPAYILLLVWSTSVDFTCGNLIAGRWNVLGSPEPGTDGFPRASDLQRRIFLIVSLVSNLGILGFFKYAGFLESSVNRVLVAAHISAMPVVQVLLPAGISFYTFESISYVMDIYYGRARPASDGVPALAGDEKTQRNSRWVGLRRELLGLNAFACYLTQFPHLVAGPIIRFQDLEGQIHHRTHRLDKFARGVFFLALGMAKKVLLANPLGEIADISFTPHPNLHAGDAWFGMVAYSFQIYFDFSGYTDMAIGLALMMGFEFSKNFDSPYKAQSITDFWRRWHISLSTWLRDYLYIPLGGNRKSETRTYFNLITVMLLGGLWHGAAWKYMIWGGIHGSWLVLERLFGKRSFYNAMPSVVRIAITFLIVSLAWVFFRSDTLMQAVNYIRVLLRGNPDAPMSLLVSTLLYTRGHIVVVIVAGLIAFLGRQTLGSFKAGYARARDCCHDSFCSLFGVAGYAGDQPVSLLSILNLNLHATHRNREVLDRQASYPGRCCRPPGA